MHPRASRPLNIREIQSVTMRSLIASATRWVMAARSHQWGAGVALVLVIGGVVAALVATLTGGGSEPVARPPAPSVTPTTPPPSPTTSAAKPSPSKSATPAPAPKPPTINPLTGGKPSNNKVIAVKVDDTSGARPQVGLNYADIVYIEQVEGGLTRLVAVFNSRLPNRVGPVRSTRNDDPEIVRQFGSVIYVASGGDHVEYRPLDRSSLRPVINDRGGPGFSRDPSRPVPLNLFSNLQTVAKNVKGPKATDIGLHWSAKITNPNRAGGVVNTRVGGTAVQFRWNHTMHRYVRYYQGHIDKLANGSAVRTPNVVVQFVRGNVFPEDIDPAGNPAWYQHTVGKGNVVVFRDGRRISGRWSRPRAVSGTELVDQHGKPISLAPGGAWFVLVNNGTSLAG